MKKVLKVVLIIFIISFLAIESLIIFHGFKDSDSKANYVIVLGAQITGTNPSLTLKNRLDSASLYLKENNEATVIVSGGTGASNEFSEAFVMAKYLESQTIANDRIILEAKSINTFENLKFSIEKIREIDSEKNIEVLIATNDYHLFRSKMLAKRLGIKAGGLASKTPRSTIIKAYVREYFAVIKSFLLDWPIRD